MGSNASMVIHQLVTVYHCYYYIGFESFLVMFLNLCRLALKAFTDQKRRFFPHLDDGLDGQSTESASKKHCGPQVLIGNHQEELSDYKTLSDILMHLEKEVPTLKIFTYERLDWLKRASSLPSSANETSMGTSKEHNFHSSNKLRPGSLSAVATEKISVIELLFPSIFRAIVSLHPAGSIDPDSVAFFSPDEVILFTRIN
jgi:mediator of RNA polymerase II transcription subunit 27